MAKLGEEFTPQAETANEGHVHLVKYCLDLFDKIKKSEYRNKKIEEIEKSIKAYRQEETDKDDLWEGQSCTELPLTTISCDNLEPRLVAGLVGKKPYIHFEMENDQKQDEPTEILEGWFNNELEDVVKIDAYAGTSTQKILREGTVYSLPSYDLKEREMRDFVFEEDMMPQVQQKATQMIAADPELQAAAQQDPERVMQALSAQIIGPEQAFQGGILIDKDGPVTQDRLETIFEGGRVDIIPFTDVFIPDDVDEWEDAPVIRKVRPTYADLVRDSESKPGYMNIDPWLCDQQEGIDIAEDALTPEQQMDSVKIHGKKTIECIECSVTYMYRKDEVETEQDEKEQDNFTEQRFIALIALDSRILIRLIPLKELSFKNEHMLKRTRLFPEQGKSYGSSLWAKMRSIQEGASKTFNMAINVAEICLIPWFFYEKKTGLDKIKRPDGKPGMKLSAGVGIPVENVQGIMMPKFPHNPDHFFNWINLWVSFWERLISIGDLQLGRQGEKERTATETMAVIQEGNIKHNHQAQTLKDDFLSVLRTVFDLYYQHMPFDKTFLWNEQQQPIPRSMMRRPYKFKLTGSTEQSNKLIKRAETEKFHSQARENPHINPVKDAEEFVKSYGYTDVSEWVSEDIRGIVEAIMTVPNAKEMVEQTLKEAQKMAQQMEAQAKEEQKAA